MSFSIKQYHGPDFSQPRFAAMPEARWQPCPMDGVAPEGYHAMGISPEYFKVEGRWHLAEESRMDCVPVWQGGRVAVVEFRNLKQGDLVCMGRTEDGSNGIYVHGTGFEEEAGHDQFFSFRQSRSRETGFSRDYEEIVELSTKRTTAVMWCGSWARPFPLIMPPGRPLPNWCGGAMCRPCWPEMRWLPMIWRAPICIRHWARISLPSRAYITVTTITWIPLTGSVPMDLFPLF